MRGVACYLYEFIVKDLDVSTFLSRDLSCSIEDLVAVVAHIFLKFVVDDIASNAI